MRVIQIPRHGPPSVFEERDMAPKPLRPQDVHIRVEAAGVNFADVMGRVGLYPDAPKLPYVPGYEIAGEVVAAGARAAGRLPPGTRVMATTRFGGYAELVRAPEHAVAALDDDVDLTAAAAVPVTYLTAWLALVRLGAAQAGERVLVHGGAGGVGLAVLDLARRHDVQLYATAGGQAKCERLEAMGVVRAFDHTQVDLEEAAADLLRGKGFHLILDPLGPESFQRSLRMLAPLGRVVCYGFSELVTGPKRRLWHAATKLLKAARVNPITLMQKNAGVIGLNLAQLFQEKDLHRHGMERLGAMVNAGEIQPVIHATEPLSAEGAARAHERLHRRENFGKVVLSRAMLFG